MIETTHLAQSYVISQLWESLQLSVSRDLVCRFGG
jgi:hypothetical protein